MAPISIDTNKKSPLTTSKSLPGSPPRNADATSRKSSSSSQTTSLRSATSLTSMPPPKTWSSSVMMVTSLLVTMFVTLFSSGDAASATILRFQTQPSDRPLALYRAPAPYQEAGKKPLNSVIITSKPFSISEGQQLMATTSSPPTASPSEKSYTRISSSSSATDSSTPAWRRTSYHSPTTDKPTITLQLPQYSIDCAEGLSCSETIAVDAATPRPTFKPYPQDVLDKFLREFANTRVAEPTDRDRDHNHDDKATEDSTDRATNRLANLYLDNEDNRSDEPEAQGTEDDREDADSEESQGKSRWHLLHAQQHHHPFDDRDGWVSLEPVPWSTSKVAKWHATHTKRPEYKPPNRYDSRPPLDWDKPSRPHYVRPSYDDEYESSHRPQGSWGSKPLHGDRWPSDPLGGKPPPHWDKPNNDYDYHKPTNEYLKPTNDYHKPSNDYDYHKPSSHWSSSSSINHDIVTDNRPNRWPESNLNSGGNGGYRPWQEQKPHYDYSHGSSHSQSQGHGAYGHGGGVSHYEPNRHPPNHPEESEGQWVLVSSTKGYAVPHRHKIFQRALAISSKPITSRRTVRLTVLPALNGTANTTISHGGLLEVESTFQSVDQHAQDQQDQLQRPSVQHDSPVLQHDEVPQLVQAVRPKTRNVRVVPAPLDNSRAVLAAVGAGMVPATLALMAPLVLGRRRRRSLLRSQRTPPDHPVQELIEALQHSQMQHVKM